MVRTRGAQRAIRAEANIVHQAEQTPRGLDQSVGERIAQVQVRCGAIVLIGGDHIGELIETLAPIRDDTSYSRPRLPVVDAVPSAHNQLRGEPISEAETRLNVVPVSHIVGALARRRKNLAAMQLGSDGLAGDSISVCETTAVQRTRDIRIKPVLVVIAICARQCKIVPQAQIQGQLCSDLPVVLREEAVLVVCSGRSDRKSTRLNSSHSSISYAVFCLKKKKYKKI